MPDLLIGQETNTAEDPALADKKACVNCGALISPNIKYCNGCGARQLVTETTGVAGQWKFLQQAALFYVLYLGVCCVSKFVDDLQTFSSMLVIEIIAAFIPVVFFGYNWAENKKALRWPNFSAQKLSAYCGMAMLGAFLIHYAVGWLNITLFSKEEIIYTEYRGNYYAEFLLIFFLAVTPALFEELGFRGYLLGGLLKVADKQQAIYISAFLFAIMHLSFISLFWLIPFALFVGDLRVREKTLWYGIFFHFCFNLTDCLFQIL